MNLVLSVTSELELFKLIATIGGTILIPLVLLILGQNFTKMKERSERSQKEAEQLAKVIEHLSSENAEKRKLALLILIHLQKNDKFPRYLMDGVKSIAAKDNPEIAAYAMLASGDLWTEKDFGLYSEVLLPLKIHLDRSRVSFKMWVGKPLKEPNETIENMIRESNLFICNLLRVKWHLLPEAYQEDAMALIEHYEAWLEEYDRVRPGGVRDPGIPYVFVGPRGKPFPVEAETRFLQLYEDCTVKRVIHKDG
jgi:hypothetical protein